MQGKDRAFSSTELLKMNISLVHSRGFLPISALTNKYFLSIDKRKTAFLIPILVQLAGLEAVCVSA